MEENRRKCRKNEKVHEEEFDCQGRRREELNSQQTFLRIESRRGEGTLIQSATYHVSRRVPRERWLDSLRLVHHGLFLRKRVGLEVVTK